MKFYYVVTLMIFSYQSYAQIAQSDILNTSFNKNPALLDESTDFKVRYSSKSMEGSFHSTETDYKFFEKSESNSAIFATGKYSSYGLGFKKSLSGKSEFTEFMQTQDTNSSSEDSNFELQISYPILGELLTFGAGYKSDSEEINDSISNTKVTRKIGVKSKIFQYVSLGLIYSSVKDQGDLKTSRIWNELSYGVSSNYQWNSWYFQLELSRESLPKVYYNSESSSDPNYQLKTENYITNLGVWYQLASIKIFAQYNKEEALSEALKTGNDIEKNSIEYKFGASFFNDLVIIYYGQLSSTHDHGKNIEDNTGSVIGVGFSFALSQMNAGGSL